MPVHRCIKGTVHCRGLGVEHMCEDPNRFGFDDSRTEGSELESRIENLFTQGGKFPNAKAYADAALQLVSLNTAAVKRVVDRVKALPEHQKKSLSIAAKLLLTVLENELKRRTGIKRPRKRK